MQVILGTSITWPPCYAGYLENLNGARIESTLRRGGWLCVMVTAVGNVVGVWNEGTRQRGADLRQAHCTLTVLWTTHLNFNPIESCRACSAWFERIHWRYECSFMLWCTVVYVKFSTENEHAHFRLRIMRWWRWRARGVKQGRYKDGKLSHAFFLSDRKVPSISEPDRF